MKTFPILSKSEEVKARKGSWQETGEILLAKDRKMARDSTGGRCFISGGGCGVLPDGPGLRGRAGPPEASVPGGLALKHIAAPKQIAAPQPGFPDSVSL